METIIIDLSNFKSSNNTLFTGRPQGEETRKRLNLNKIDKDNSIISFVIPEGTTSFNPSFYLGLLFDSIKALGIEGFHKKYRFTFKDDNKKIINVLKDNLIDGERNAINVINKKSGLSKFL